VLHFIPNILIVFCVSFVGLLGLLRLFHAPIASTSGVFDLALVLVISDVRMLIRRTKFELIIKLIAKVIY